MATFDIEAGTSTPASRPPPDDAALHRLAMAVGDALLARRQRVALAESCTGGWVAKCLTDIAGSSRWFERGFVTYSNEAKQQSLGVAPDVLARFGAVSRQTAEQMARGALEHSGVDISVAVTGIAGPDGGTPGKPVGLVWFARAERAGRIGGVEHRFAGSREDIRRSAVATALQLILSG
jgi:nicotinamide-nucleotide amidase